jgi:Arylsulfotransferase (ASST)
MAKKFTRRRFLVAAGATYLALTNLVGCELLGRAPGVSSVRTPEVGPVSIPRRVLPLPGIPSAPEEGAWSFRSRPDLSPPVAEVATRAHDTAPGYVFVAPQTGGAGQGGSLILDDRGEVVWFRPLPAVFGRAMDLKVQSYKGSPVLTWMETPGEVASEYVIADSTYREIARIRAANGYDGDHHEFHISPQDTALITIYSPVPVDLTPFGGLQNGLAWQGIIQELDIETGEVIFEWRSLEHVGFDETYAELMQDGRSGFDYFHINSIDVDHDDNLLVSARETFAVYKIDRRSGQIIWRLGGKKSDFEMQEGTRFAFQHDARRLADGTISIFDNGTTVFHDDLPEAIEESRAIVLEVDEDNMKAKLVGEYTHPNKMFADAAGNTQVLPNGNVLVGWGRALATSEFDHDGKMLFDLKLPAENRSYRSFRFPWNAQPDGAPAVDAERTSSEEARVYASWNGATEVESWEVLAGPGQDRLESLGEVPRDGFETAMLVRTSEAYVAVKARDSSGRELGITRVVET